MDQAVPFPVSKETFPQPGNMWIIAAGLPAGKLSLQNWVAFSAIFSVFAALSDKRTDLYALHWRLLPFSEITTFFTLHISMSFTTVLSQFGSTNFAVEVTY